MPDEPSRDQLSLGEFTEKIARLATAVPLAYLRGAEAALSSDPPDLPTARELLRQALKELGDA